MSLVVFDKVAAGPPFTQGQPTSVAFGPYSVGDIADLAAGSITKLGPTTTHAAPASVTKPTKHTADY